MKNLILLFALCSALFAQDKVIIETPHETPEVPLFYTSSVEATATIRPNGIRETLVLKFQIIQGEAERLSLELSGDAKVTLVKGPELASWAVRKVGEKRFLDLTPKNKELKELSAFATLERIDLTIPGQYSLSTIGAAKASSLSAIYEIKSIDGMGHRLVTAEKASPLSSDDEKIDRLVSSELAKLNVEVFRSASTSQPIELQNARLVGKVDQEGGSASFSYFATALVTGKTPVSLEVLRGRAAPLKPIVTADYRLKLTNGRYQIEFLTEGAHLLELEFVTPLVPSGEWKSLDFCVPGGAVVPIELTGISQTSIFNPELPVIPTPMNETLQGFLPANGHLQTAWQPERKASDSKLFFTSEAMSDFSVGAGLLRQVSLLKVKALQGSLSSLNCQLAGTGEILAVEGENVLSWKVTEKRVLEIALSRPVTKEASFVLRAQSALDSLPVKTEPLRFTPLDAVRHSGHFRVYNSGAVRLEVMKTVGLTQLSPDQYPESSALPKNKRQIFYYRYPSAKHSFIVAADRVKPEINVSQVLSYELTETDRVFHADIELDIREAAIREWELLGPADYSVVAVTGADVADYVASAPEKGARRIKVIFGKEVAGRRLVKLHLEKNEAAKAGAWSLPVLTYPGSKSVRGELGMSAAPGFRVSPSKSEGLTEMPLVHFQKRSPRLQQAFRIRGNIWKSTMTIEALSQNVQADVFHLYSLKENTAYVSVLVNYFVTGAPVSEWKLTLPAGIENVNVDGRDVRDSRNADGQLIVPLHRPVMGAYQLLVTYEQAATQSFKLGELTPESVQGERGFIQVVSPGQVKLNTQSASENLVKLDPLELPAEYRLMSRAPSLAAYQYTSRPMSLNASVSWFERGDTARLVVEFAKFSSRIARDGGVVTDAVFDVRSRGERTLHMMVPDSLDILEVTVDGQQVTVREASNERLIPLPETVGPNSPVRVAVRASGANVGDQIKLSVPSVVGATQLMTRWDVKPDTGHVLEPLQSHGLERLTSFSKENGFSWIDRTALPSFILLLAVWILGSLVMRVKAGVSIVGAALVLFAATGAFYLGSQGMNQESSLPDALEYSVPVATPNQVLSLVVAHREDGAAKVPVGGGLQVILAMVLGVAAWKFSKFRIPLAMGSGMLLSLGLLSQVGGAGWFFWILGAVILFLWFFAVRRLLPDWRELFRGDDEEDDDEEDDEISSSGVTAVLLAGLMVLFGADHAHAATADSLSEKWTLRDGRLQSESVMQLSGEAGERFLLLQAPATLTKFEGEGLKVMTEGGHYFVVPGKTGQFEAKFTYQSAVPDVAVGVPVLTGLASVRSLIVNYIGAGWSIDSPSAVRTKSLDGFKGSATQLWLAPDANAVVKLSPQARDVSSEKTQFFAELDHLYVPGPGVIDGRHRLRIRPAQGQVKQLTLTIPEGFTVSEVTSQAAGPWRFDPEKRLLTIEMAPFQSRPFAVLVETQRALSSLPAEVTLEPMRVADAAGEVGMIALAFGKEAQLDRDEAKGLSQVNLTDFGSALLPRDRENKPTASLQKVYRYSKAAASLKVKVTPVAPEVRVVTQQRLSFGDERIVFAVDLTARITRAGVFRLSFPLAKGFEVESLTGGALNHWVEVEEGGQRVVVINLNGKTMGEQKFSIVLTSMTPALPLKNWTVPKVVLVEAERQSGQLIVVPGRGIQLQVQKRQDLSALDPRSVGGNQPGSLAFRLLQKSWKLSLGVDQLEPSLAVTTLHDVELREGHTRSRIDLKLQIDHASIREFVVVLPGLSEVDAQTVRASGAEVRDIVNLENGSWQVRLKRRVIGETRLRIEYEQNTEVQILKTCELPAARQQELFLALRPGARLELTVGGIAKWARLDWVSLPKDLLPLDRSGAPSAFFRTTRPGGGVEVSLKRHSVASVSKIRVLSGRILTVISANGESMNRADLELEMFQRGSLSLTLPPRSRLFGVFVNEESALVVKDGDDYRFNVTGDSGGNTAKLRVAYASQSSSELELTALKIGEPLENVIWTVAVPEGYRLSGSGGDLDLSDQGEAHRLNRAEYRALVSMQNSQKEQDALGRLGKVSAYLKAGEQAKAAQTLEQVWNGSALDAASNEDARVKLENLVTQQAVVGLNTRRQRLYLDNRAELQQADYNDQLEVAANANPVFAGNLNFGKDDYANVIQGNDADVNRMLSTIATKWIRHQRSTEPVTQMLDPVIPVSGKPVVFTRQIQVRGDEALGLRLELENEQPKKKPVSFLVMLLVLAAVVVGVLTLKERPAGE